MPSTPPVAPDAPVAGAPSPTTRRTRSWWLLAGPASIALLAWCCRGAAFGAPILDDFTFLYALRFERPLDWLGGMGWIQYWRPVSRQLYFSTVGPFLLSAPWVGAAVHAVLLLALFTLLYRIARRFASAPVAAAVASFPLLVDASRVLLVWPSGSQHLIPATFLVLMAHECVSRRWWTGLLAGAAALLSNEVALLIVLPTTLGLAWGALRRRVAPGWAAAFAAIVLLWFGGLSVAQRHGVAFPSDRSLFELASYLRVLALSLHAQLNLQDLGRPWATPIAAGYLLLGIASLLAFRRPAARTRLRSAAPLLAVGAAWFLLLSAPLTYVQPGWTAWRSVLPGIGLGVVVMGVVGSGSGPALLGLVLLRSAALILSPQAPERVEAEAPRDVSELSFAPIVRFQMIVNTTRDALHAAHPTLPPRAVVRYWQMPERGNWAFVDWRAVRVWYGDSTITWEGFGSARTLDAPVDALIAYNLPSPSPAVVVSPAALESFRLGLRAGEQGRLAESDSLLSASLRLQSEPATPLSIAVARIQARVAFVRGQLERARSINALDLELEGSTLENELLSAEIALGLGDERAARAALHRALAMDPASRRARALAERLDPTNPPP